MKIGLSRSMHGKARIEYSDKGGKAVVIFEPVGNYVLESRFDDHGFITDQKLLKNGQSVDQVIKGFVGGIGASEIIDEEYRDVTLQKECPKCGGSPLTRYMDTVLYPKEAPVMPFYICGKCKEKSYYLTDAYLRNLVTSNKELFDDAELSQMQKDEAAFMKELRAYIIRIFASQRIMYIK